MTLAEVAAGAGRSVSGWGYARPANDITREILSAGSGARAIVYGGRGHRRNQEWGTSIT